MMKVHRVSRFLFALAVLTPAGLSAQAFGLNEIGACATGRSYANTAAPCKDASVIYWNPAAAGQLPGWNLDLGASSIDVASKFSQDSTGRVYNGTQPTAIVPSAFLTYHAAGSKAAYGLGFYVPYGLTSQWDNSFPGRFMAQKAAIKTFYVQPNLSWQLTPKWAIGGGPVFGHSTVELVQALDLSTQRLPTGATFGQLGIARNTQFATAKIKGSSNGFGAALGAYGQLTPNWTFGARFLAPIYFKYKDADATFTQVPTGLTFAADVPNPAGGAPLIPAGTPVDAVVAGQFSGSGTLTAQKVSTTIVHPAQIQAGFGYTGYKDWLIDVDYAWVGWKQFDQMVVTFNNAAMNETIINDYNHSSAIRVGAEYTMPTSGWKFRGGFSGVASAAPPETVTPMLPEQDRNYFTLGAGVPVFGKITADAAYAYVHTPGARGRTASRTSRSQTAADLNTGVYDLSANIFSLTLKASF